MLFAEYSKNRNDSSTNLSDESKNLKIIIQSSQTEKVMGKSVHCCLLLKMISEGKLVIKPTQKNVNRI